MNRPINIATGQPASTARCTSDNPSRRPRNSRHRYRTPDEKLCAVSARAIPIGVVPSRRGQTRFTSACTLRLFVGEPGRVGQVVPVAGIQQRTRHHRDGRPTRDAVALPKMKRRKFHRSSR